MSDESMYRPPVVVNVARRPIYEKQINIDHEKLFCERVKDISLFEARQIRKRLYPCDIVLLDKKIVKAFIEFKSRRGALGYEGGVMLSLSKISTLVIFGTLTGLPILFIIDNGERNYHVAVLRFSENNPYKTVIGGRTDRNDAGDTEPVVLIPRSDFIPLPEYLRSLRGGIAEKLSNSF